MRVRLADQEVFYHDEISGIFLSRLGEGVDEIDLPDDGEVDYANPDLAGAIQRVSRLAYVKRSIDAGILVAVDEGAPAAKPVAPMAPAPFDRADKEERAKEFTAKGIVAMGAEAARAAIREITDLALLQEVERLERARRATKAEPKRRPRKMIIAEIAKRLEKRSVGGAGIVRSEDTDDVITVNRSPMGAVTVEDIGE